MSNLHGPANVPVYLLSKSKKQPLILPFKACVYYLVGFHFFFMLNVD